MLLLFSSNAVGESKSIIGSWVGTSTEDGILVFHNSGKMEIFSSTGEPLVDKPPIPTITWEAIEEVIPNQLYMTIEADGKKMRRPLGIYKIVNGKLILREPIEYHRSFGGFDLGVSRYEIPKDFSGVLKVFKKIK